MYREEIKAAIENFYNNNFNTSYHPWDEFENAEEFFAVFEDRFIEDVLENRDEETAKAAVIADPKEVKEMIARSYRKDDCINFIVSPDYTQIDFMVCKSMFERLIEDFEDSIKKDVDFEIKIARKEDFEMIEEDYCPTSDTTYLMKHTYIKGELSEREVIGFYSGEPHKEATEAYSTVCKGTKATYIL